MNCAVIVETRPIDLEPIIARHMDYLPGWKLKMVLKTPFPINNFRYYNRLMVMPAFWETLVKFDRVLIFQHDSGLLRMGIEKFLEWDYVGAPWGFQDRGGNGGLSLRNPRKMLEITKSVKYLRQNEDVYFCNALGGTLAPREICSNFSVESIYKLGTLGYHGIEKWLTKEQINSIKKQYNGTA